MTPNFTPAELRRISIILETNSDQPDYDFWSAAAAAEAEDMDGIGLNWHDTIHVIGVMLAEMTEDDRNDAIEALRSRFEEIYTREQ